MQKLLRSTLFLIVVFVFVARTATAERIVGCCYGTWANNRTGNGNFVAENIDPTLCTHIFYAYMGIDENGEVTSLNIPFDRPFNHEDGNIAKTVALKIINKDLKVLASVGGNDQGSERFSKMAATPETRAKFIQSVLAGVVGNRFDGVDIAWHYPTQGDGSSFDDFYNFVAFLKELNAVFKPRGLLLTVSVSGDVRTALVSYDIPSIVPIVDFINVMSYGHSDPSQKSAGFYSPLQGPGFHNVKSVIDYYLGQGVPPNKLVLGISFYGSAYTLENPKRYKPEAPVSGAGEPGPYTQQPGVLGYNEICEKLKVGWKEHWDWTYVMPYASKGNQWIGFDNERSIEWKINFLRSENLAGAVVWSIDSDDFLGTCGKKYPLLTAVHLGVNKEDDKRSFLERIKNIFGIKSSKD